MQTKSLKFPRLFTYKLSKFQDNYFDFIASLRQSLMLLQRTVVAVNIVKLDIRMYCMYTSMYNNTDVCNGLPSTAILSLHTPM